MLEEVEAGGRVIKLGQVRPFIVPFRERLWCFHDLKMVHHWMFYEHSSSAIHELHKAM